MAKKLEKPLPKKIKMGSPVKKGKPRVKPVRRTNSATADRMVSKNAKQLFALWLAGPSREEFADMLNENKAYLGEFASVSFEDARKGIAVLAKMLLDNAKTIMPKHANFMLDDFLDGYLSEEERTKLVEE